MIINLKKILPLITIAMIAIINISIYWNVHLYYRAEENIEDIDKKIKILERANQIYPSNGLVFYELGKAYFDLGIQNLHDRVNSESYLRKSIESYSRSIKINPASFFSHFNFAQSLLYMSFFYPSYDISYYDEYRKAALLAGHNHQIFYEVGKIYLSIWPEISEKDKDFTFDILRKIASGKEREKLQNLMQIWDLNVKDYAVMEKILPEDAVVYRFYARFLGEKSLSLEKRQEMLARAEFMEFERAKNEYHAGENDFLYFRLKEASKHFKSCVNALDKINFYQSLIQQTLIGSSEFIELRKSTMLNLAKCQIEMGRTLEEVEGNLRLYLKLEDEVAEVGKLELYLRSRELIEEKLETNLDDLNRLSFHILLSFKQNRYRDIMRVGNILRESFLVVPEAQKNAFVNILLLIGDSYQKVDYIYDALEFYEKALEIESDNLKALLRIRQNHERMNEEEKIRETDKKIEKLMAPRERMFKNLLINKGQKYSQILNFDGREIILTLHFKGSREKDIILLICIFFNGKVVWESYLKNEGGFEGEKVEAGEESETSAEADKIVSLSLKSNIGKNMLIVMPVDRPVNLLKIIYQ
ncbi:hypothetical protein LCGC14_0742110 [marine sediment metagenome]|uniref:Uncharacterized protein n=1 Tax=marine sediment metagenome TaxID=412755 RepID=A0A0F9TDG2_9ZZZZ